MSIHAISWALKLQGLKSTEKFVLVCLADNCNETTGLAYPSVKSLCDSTCQDRKTVMANLHSLIAKGIIVDTGTRMGVTKQVIVYTLNMEWAPADVSNSTEIGTGTKNGTVPKFPPNSTVFPSEQYRFSAKQGGKQSQKRYTEPKKEELRVVRSERTQKTATRIPEDFDLTPERRTIAEKERIPPERTMENFRDYWKAATGAKARKMDWDAAWRVWCRSDYNRPRGGSTPVKDAYRGAL
jgi:hypothetical protein